MTPLQLRKLGVRTPKVFVMKIASKKLLLLPLITTFVGAQALAQQIKPDEAKRIELNQAYGKLPLSFEANQGQTDPQVKFLSRGNGYSLFLTPTEAVLVLKKKRAIKTLTQEYCQVRRSTTRPTRLNPFRRRQCCA
jgi:hypothetical protein